MTKSEKNPKIPEQYTCDGSEYFYIEKGELGSRPNYRKRPKGISLIRQLIELAFHVFRTRYRFATNGSLYRIEYRKWYGLKYRHLNGTELIAPGGAGYWNNCTFAHLRLDEMFKAQAITNSIIGKPKQQ